MCRFIPDHKGGCCLKRGREEGAIAYEGTVTLLDTINDVGQIVEVRYIEQRVSLVEWYRGFERGECVEIKRWWEGRGVV